MKANQIAATLYTVRDFVTTPETLVSSLKKLKAMGYAAFQGGSFPVPLPEVRKIAADEGLAILAPHFPMDQILAQPSEMIDKLGQLGCNEVAYAYPAGIKMESLDDIKAFARQLNTAGAAYQKAGITLLYHNHSIEFQRFGGKAVLDIIYDETDPKNLQGEIDTYWIQHGGGNPVAWCQKMKGRLPHLHCKDYCINPQMQPVFAEVGNGNLDWQNIIAAADAAGCQWYLVEQDTCPGDPFGSMKMSAEFLKSVAS